MRSVCRGSERDDFDTVSNNAPYRAMAWDPGEGKMQELEKELALTVLKEQVS